MGAALARRREPRLGEDLYEAHLAHGMPVFVLTRPGYDKKYASFATRYGSVDSRFRRPGGDWVTVPDGIAHFLEHQMFAQEYGDAFERFSEYGASSNAFTSYTNTTYLFSCTDRFTDSLRLLLDFVQQPYFTDAGTNKERGIIQQEIRMYRDNPGWRLSEGIKAALFQRHPFRLDIAGTVESVEQITTDLLRMCWDTFYHPSNMVLSVVGDVDPNQVVELAEAALAAHPRKEQGPIERAVADEPDTIAQPRVESEMAVARPMIALGFKETDTSVAGDAVLRREMTTEICLEALSGRSSPLYNRLYEAGVIDSTFHAYYHGERDFGLSVLTGEAGDPDAFVDGWMKGVRALLETGIDPAVFERQKRRMAGEFASSFNSPEALSYALNATYFSGSDLFAYGRLLDALTLEDVNRRLHEHFEPSRTGVSVVKPKI
jgi:predicted Zn-dependent peptidase